MTAKQVRFPLTKDGITTSTGQAGNRAGIVLGQNTMLEADALKNTLVTTHDAAGNVFENASGSSLLAVSVLPGGRQEVSFRTVAGPRLASFAWLLRGAPPPGPCGPWLPAGAPAPKLFIMPAQLCP
ncbi:MAG: hypothetical protein EOO36_06925 [Cytophagaceae bacterium]|nr:MAG: hypothetical protein EOO36_06925 [Cytophagaceae bacterium]